MSLIDSAILASRSYSDLSNNLEWNSWLLLQSSGRKRFGGKLSIPDLNLRRFGIFSRVTRDTS